MPFALKINQERPVPLLSGALLHFLFLLIFEFFGCTALHVGT